MSTVDTMRMGPGWFGGRFNKYSTKIQELV